MADSQQMIEVIRQMLQEKVKERDLLRKKLEVIQSEIKQIDIAISTFQAELEKLTGEKVAVKQVPLRGIEIREAALEALRSLGGQAHYLAIKEEIEKHHTINGINEKSKSDSVWNQLNRSDEVEKIGRGEFRIII